MDSNSQFSPQAPPSSSSHQDSLAKSDVTESEKSTAPAAGGAGDAARRAQSIQEMREKERRRREMEAGKIDMSEQHKLISQFEQNFAPPS